MVPLEIHLGGLARAHAGLDGLVGLLARNDLRLALAGLKVGHSDVQVFPDDASVYELVDSDAHRALVYVKDDTGAAVVVLEGHALVDRGVHLDVNIVASLRGVGMGGEGEGGGEEREWEGG